MSAPLWAGAGYAADEGAGGGARLRALASPPPPPDEGAPPPEGHVEDAPPSDRGRAPGGVVVPARGLRPGAWARVLRAATRGRWRGLEDEGEWLLRVDLARAQAPLPLGRCGAVVVAQPKGGVGKTPVSVLIDASLRAHTRAQSLVWDLNDNGGGRWELPGGSPSVEGLVGAALAHGATRAAVTASLVVQDEGAYTVLAARQGAPELRGAEFQAVWGVLGSWFDHVVVDTGNSLASANLGSALGAADVVVVPTDYSDAALEPTLALLGRLEELWGAGWGQRVVLVPSAPVGAVGADYLEGAAAHVVPVPFDPHIAQRGPLSYRALAPATKRAGLALVAAVMDVYRDAIIPTSTNEEQK